GRRAPRPARGRPPCPCVAGNAANAARRNRSWSGSRWTARRRGMPQYRRMTPRRFRTKMVLIQRSLRMISLSAAAHEHFRKLVEQEATPGLGIRLRAVDAGTPRGDCQLEFCEPADRD